MSIIPVLLALLATAPPAVVPDSDGLAFGGHCPSAQPLDATRVRNLLTTPLLPELRARFDLGTATADRIEPLTNERDLETCRALWQAVRASGTNLSPGDVVSFFRSGDRFFVPIRREPPRAPGVVIRLDGYSSLDVYDAEFRLVGRFGA
jgi:hypothetical protein